MKSMSPRRTFLGRAAFAAYALIAHRLAGPVVASSAVAATATPALAEGLASWAPAYVPSEYRFTRQAADVVDGFQGGADETALVYHKRTHPQGQRYPLQIFRTRATSQYFFGTGARPGQPVEITLRSGVQVTAQYFDGMWARGPERIEWSTASAHSLVLTTGDRTVGIRGFRPMGVTREELLRVAASIA